MKKNLIIVVIILIVILSFIILKNVFSDLNDVSEENENVISNEDVIKNGDVLVEIINFSYEAVSVEEINSLDYVAEEKKHDYIIYSNGIIEQSGTGNENIKGALQEKKLEIIKELVEEIDESKIHSVPTLLPVSSGQIITVYNSEKRGIKIKDANTYNDSEAAKKIIEILDTENLL